MMIRGLAAVVLMVAGGACQAQGKAEFDVASVRQNKLGGASFSNFPLNPGPQYSSKGGLLVARNMPVLQFIVFAYTPDMYQIQTFRSKLPEWARSARFDIEARAEGSPTKDEMRGMMRSLLEERFHMAVHRETREVPAYALVVVKAGKMGAGLKVHAADDPECNAAPLPEGIAGGYPVECGSAASIAAKTPGNIAAGGFKMTMDKVALAVGGFGGVVDRPVVDRTGLAGSYDFRLEYTPEPSAVSQADMAALIESTGTTFLQALKEQLGLKLVPTTAKVDVVVLDRLEMPVEN